MLVLSRRVGEKIIINDNIEVMILSVEGKKVRCGIKAPDDVMIYRNELYEKKKSKNKDTKKEEKGEESCLTKKEREE